MKRTLRQVFSIIVTFAILLAAVGIVTPTSTTLTSTAALPEPPEFAEQTEENNIIGKTITGYQAWFGQGWYHNWANTSERGNLFFEMWPKTDDYPAELLWESRFKTLRNGQPAMLFNSTDSGIIDTHFGWMEENGIDCAAVQRFYSYTRDNYSVDFRYLKVIMQEAERHDRLFYMMYDMSGAGTTATNAMLSRIQNDFINNIENQGLVESEAYAHADGKPVICLWGLSSVEAGARYPNADAALALVNWFHERGYYVIIGTPDNGFSTVTDAYAEVYAAADMISPWYVGRYKMSGVGTALRQNVAVDKGYCDKNGIDFLPVIFPGFAWTHLQKNTAYNETPRHGGNFLWRQAAVLAMHGCETVYFAMFDEYDESTALMKAATDSTEIPAGNTYFLTLAADGYWLSDDYYLRLAGAIGTMLDDVAAGKYDPMDIITDIPIDFSNGPVYYRNGFTYHIATINEQPVRQRLDPCVTGAPRSIIVRGSDKLSLDAPDLVEQNDTDGWFYRFAGQSTATADSAGAAHRLISETKFTLAADTVLSYRLRANDQNGTAVYVNLQLEDGTLLSHKMLSTRDTKAKSGEWVTVNVPISNDFVGKKVTAIVASCDLAASGAFSADIDDILIEIGDTGCGDFTAEPDPAQALLGDADSNGKVNTTDARFVLQYAADVIGADDLDLSVSDVDRNNKVNTTDARRILQYAAGLITEF